MANKDERIISYSDILDRIRSNCRNVELCCVPFISLLGPKAAYDFANGQYFSGAVYAFSTLLFGAVAVKADITRRSPERQEKELEFLEEMVESRNHDLEV